jgi:ABC-type polysaccharide/polyol phosphate export permease
VLLCLFLLGLGTFLAVLTPRFRDIAPLFGSLMMMGYFVTPVLWRPTHLGAYAFIAEINPLTHFMALVREPLLGHAASAQSWAIAAGCAVISLIIGLFALGAVRHRITHWV